MLYNNYIEIKENVLNTIKNNKNIIQDILNEIEINKEEFLKSKIGSKGYLYINHDYIINIYHENINRITIYGISIINEDLETNPITLFTSLEELENYFKKFDYENNKDI